MKTLTFTLIFAAATLVSSVAAAGESPFSPGYYICETMEGDTSYFSDIFLGPGDASAVGKGFREMLAAKYGYTGRVNCPRANNSPDVLKLLQEQHAPYAAQRAQQGRKIVETGWTYGGAPSLSIATPPPKAAGSAPKSNAQSAYEQALAAQRPRSVSQAQLAAAAKTPASERRRASTIPRTPGTSSRSSEGTAAGKYTFCSSTGNTRRGTAQSHYYITGIFPVTTASAHPDGEFGRYLRAQHPQENNSASCVPPGPMSTVEHTRRMNIENNRKSFPDRAIVEMPWKPTP